MSGVNQLLQRYHLCSSRLAPHMECTLQACGLYPMVGLAGTKAAGKAKNAVCIQTRRNESVLLCSSSINSTAQELACEGQPGQCTFLAYEEVTRGAPCQCKNKPLLAVQVQPL